MSRAERISVSHDRAGASKPSSMREHPRQRVRPFEARVVVHMAPVEQEAKEIARRDRLDLGPQTVDGAAVHAGDKPPVAPLLVVDPRIEAAAQDRAFRFERGQRAGERRRLQPKRRRERRRRHRARSLKPAAQERDQRLVAGPGLSHAV